nr:MAG TPA: hypothetical protein [Herelleviridae sp.]
MITLHLYYIKCLKACQPFFNFFLFFFCKAFP